jgi:trimethylamine--corrinoid protein Co-methyltransferase
VARRSSVRQKHRLLASEPPPRPPRRLRLQMLGDDDLVQMRQGALAMLWDTGVRIDDSKSRQMLLATGECREGDDGFIHFGNDLVERTLETVASRVRLYDRNGDLRVDTLGETLNFCPGRNCVNTLDHLTGEIRPCVLDDIRNVGKVCQALDYIDAVGSLGYPQDVPAEVEALYALKILSEETIKPITFIGHDEVETEAMWEFLADSVGGWDALADKPCGMDLTGPLSPLRVPSETCRRVRFAAERNIPVVCYPALFPGMSGPITLVGSVVQATVESLAGIVLNQLERPGAPIMAGASILPMDMRQADLAYGSPEYSLAGSIAVEFLHYLGIPSWVGAGCSDSHVVDQQAAAEAGANMLSAALSGTAFIHNLGMLAGGRTGSIEMLVLADEIAASVTRHVAGVKVDVQSIATEVVHRAAPDNTFLMDQHTQDNYMSEMWRPRLFQRCDKDAWLEAGAQDMGDRILDKLNEIL